MNTTSPAPRDTLVDEIVAESFPASDSPTWNATHAGAPALRPPASEHGPEIRSHLRADLERLTSGVTGRARDHGRRAHGGSAELDRAGADAREARLADALLVAGRPVVRHPVGPGVAAYDLETELRGAVGHVPPVVVVAPYDGVDATPAAVLLAIVRALGGATMRRAIRMFAFREADHGAARIGAYLRAMAPRPLVLLSIARMGLGRSGSGAATFWGDRRSRSFVDAAQRAFGAASRIESRSFSLPSWLPRVHRPEQRAARAAGVPAIAVADHDPWTRGGALDADADRMAAAVGGLAAVVEQLAGRRV